MKIKQLIFIVSISLLMTPSIALASWWNPFTWKVFHKPEEVKTGKVITQPINATSTEKKINEIKANSSYSHLTYQDTLDQALNVFLEQYPKYKPENDANDILWGKFQNIIKSGKYDINAKTQEQLISIFKKIDQDVVSLSTKPASETPVKTIPNIGPIIPYVESWEQIEARDFATASANSWTSLISTNSLGEKRYYRKENNKWIRKNTENEASQPYINSLTPSIEQTSLTELYLKQSGLRKAVSDMISEITPEEYETFSGAEKRAAKNKDMEVLEKSIDEVEYEIIKTAQANENLLRIYFPGYVPYHSPVNIPIHCTSKTSMGTTYTDCR